MKGNYVIKKHWLEQDKWTVAWIAYGWVQPFASYKSEKIAVGVQWLLNRLDGR